MNEGDEVLAAVASHLNEYGIELTVLSGPRGPAQSDSGADAVLELSKGRARARYVAQVKARMTLSAMAHRDPAGPDPVLAVGEHIDNRSAAAFRHAGLQYADASGNAFIQFGDVYVEVRGRRPSSDADVGRMRATGNLFSTRRSQAIMALLAWPELWTAQVRDLAAAAGVSTGQAHDTLVLLEQADFRGRSSPDSRRQTELLDYWTAAYPTGLGPKLALGFYSGNVGTAIKDLHLGHAVYLSGESADGVDIRRPATLTLYVADLDPMLPVVNRWRRDSDVEPNVFVRHKFWTSPREQRERPEPHHLNAPWPLVYADLMAAGDARLAEAAQTWKARFVRSDAM